MVPLNSAWGVPGYALQSYSKRVSAGPCAPGEYIWLRGVVHGIMRLLVDTASCPLAFARHQIFTAVADAIERTGACMVKSSGAVWRLFTTIPR